MRALGPVAVATMAVLLFTGGAASASIPDASGVYQGCYRRNQGSLRIIDGASGDSCSNNEVAVTWSQTGPQGPKGTTGDTGATGAKGDKGDQGLMGYSLVNDPSPNLAGCPGSSGHGFQIVDSFGAVIAGSQVVVCDGATGAPGAKGDTGAPGAKGDTGAPGAKGDTGDTGPRGLKGDTGDTGAQGPTGPAGPALCPCWNEGSLRLFFEAHLETVGPNCQRGAHVDDGTRFAFIYTQDFSTAALVASQINSTSGVCEMISSGNTNQRNATLEQLAACRSEIIDIGKTIGGCF
jgi:collagen triple helix repeat protein